MYSLNLNQCTDTKSVVYLQLAIGEYLIKLVNILIKFLLIFINLT